jgi:phosphonatase-like hydrolase
MIGTTIQDSNKGVSLINDSFQKAFLINGFQVSFLEMNHQRGKSKKEAINNILDNKNQSDDIADKIYSDFIDLLNYSLISFSEIDGATDVFRELKEHGIKIGLGSGLPMDLIVKIIKTIGWKFDDFDYIGSSEEFGKGRPDPIMINDSLFKLNLKDKSGVLKIGDTAADIQEGKNAGVLTAGVLTGTQKREELEKYKPDYIFSDIKEIINII